MPDLCECPRTATQPHECVDCPVHGEAANAVLAAEAAAEERAENAWLHAAENANYEEER